jgi:hypothetical protein
MAQQEGRKEGGERAWISFYQWWKIDPLRPTNMTLYPLF